MITIVFSSYNGAGTLPTMLEALCAMRTDALRYKIVAVDNNSTDDTARILQSYRGRLPLTYLFEARRGKNAALNKALPEIEGDIVVMTDDDVVPRPDWLAQIKAAFDAHPDVDVVGGRIEPLWPAPPEPWLLKSVPLPVAYSATPALQDGPTGPDTVWGPNMAFRARLFRDGLRFNDAIGPDGTGGYAMGSEADFCRRLHLQGRKMWHCSGAVVKHIVRERQMTRRWLCGRAYRFGRGQTRLSGTDVDGPRVFGVPRYLIRHTARAATAYLAAALNGEPAARFAALWDIAYGLGVAREMRFRRRMMREAARRG